MVTSPKKIALASVVKQRLKKLPLPGSYTVTSPKKIEFFCLHILIKMESMLNQIDAQIKAQQAREAELTKQLEELKALKAKEEEFMNREKALADKETELADKEKALEQYRNEVLQWELKTRQEIMELQNAKKSGPQGSVYKISIPLSHYGYSNSYLYTLNGTLYCRGEEDRHYEVLELYQKEQSLTEKERTLTEKEQSLTEKERALTEKEQTLFEKESFLKGREEGLAVSHEQLVKRNDELAEKERALVEREQKLAKNSYDKEQMESLMADAICARINPNVEPVLMFNYVLAKIERADEKLENIVPVQCRIQPIRNNDKYFLGLMMDNNKNQSSIIIPISIRFTNYLSGSIKDINVVPSYGYFNLCLFKDNHIGICDLVSNPPKVLYKTELKKVDFNTLAMWAQFTNLF